MAYDTPNLVRVKRQEEAPKKTEESFETEICKDKDAGEWFRLVAGEGDTCRDVIQCTSSVRRKAFFFLKFSYRHYKNDFYHYIYIYRHSSG